MAGAAAIAIGALMTPAVAHAEKEWDIGVYDNCIKKVDQRFLDDEITYEQKLDETMHCCILSGGELEGSFGTCTAPPARPAVDVMPKAPTGVLDQGETQAPRPQAPRPLPPVIVDTDTPQQSSPPKPPTVVFQPGSS
ncbi:hypothetical protein H7J93_21245 [Mycobacterium barrassiae]|uniref:hypothetical protein n=1 Tax=Mycobacterium barrassiae TaxID=319709 RepID=UPI002265AC8E|nr:hypothetical protein [Mycobacterium barrassiae]MCV7302158.1 hypothetical protein [Mycobacterium barrassiae]